MTAGEYQGLVEFLGRRFDAIDERFREVFGHFDEIYRRLERFPATCRGPRGTS